MATNDSTPDVSSEQEATPLESANKPYEKPSFTEYFNIFSDAFAAGSAE